MTTIVTTDVVNDTATDAGVMNANFAAIKAVVNGAIDNANISASAGISPSKIAPGSETYVLTTVAGVATWSAPSGGGASGDTPVGAGIDYWGSSAPSGWLFADGSAISRTTYSDLFAVMGTTHGAGDGSTTFNLPDKRGRVSVMKGTHASVDTLGENDGVAVANRRAQHRHTAHSHGISFRSSAGAGGSVPTAAGSDVHNYTATTASVDGGSGNASDSLDAPAHIVCNYIIFTGV